MKIFKRENFQKYFVQRLVEPPKLVTRALIQIIYTNGRMTAIDNEEEQVVEPAEHLLTYKVQARPPTFVFELHDDKFVQRICKENIQKQLKVIILKLIIVNYQLNANICLFQLDMFRATCPSSGAIEYIISFTNAAYGVL